MSAFAVEIQGLERLRGYFRRSPLLTATSLQNAVQKASVLVQREERIEAPVDRGRLRSSIGVVFLTLGAMVGPTAKYARDVHEGRPPRKRISATEADNIMKWAKRKGLPPLVILNSIRRKGTKPNRFIERAARNSQKGVQSIFDKAIEHVVLEAGK